MRAILGDRRVRWSPRDQSTRANRGRVVDCSQWRRGFSRDRAVPSFVRAAHLTADDRVVSIQHGGVARDGLNDRAAIVRPPEFRPPARVRICYGHSWRRHGRVAEFKCVTFGSFARRRNGSISIRILSKSPRVWRPNSDCGMRTKACGRQYRRLPYRR